jgi:hypothetical protein
LNDRDSETNTKERLGGDNERPWNVAGHEQDSIYIYCQFWRWK